MRVTADGITLSNNIITATPKTEISAKGTKYYKIETNLVEDFTYQYSYINKSGELITKKRTIISLNKPDIKDKNINNTKLKEISILLNMFFIR